MGALTPGHLLLILVIALIVIGPGKLPEVGAAIGKSVREFQKASGQIQDSLLPTLGTHPAQPQAQAPSQAQVLQAQAQVLPATLQPPAQSYYAQPGFGTPPNPAQQPYVGQPYPQPAYAPQPSSYPAQPYVAAPEYPSAAPSAPAQATAYAPAPDAAQPPASGPRVDG